MSYGNSDSALNAFTITKSDTTVFPAQPNSSGVCVTKAIYVGGTGDVNVVMQGGQTVLFSAVPAGTILPISVSQVKSASTTATLMLGLW